MAPNSELPDDRQPGRMPECEACGSLAPEGGGMHVGDETFGWACSECRGDSALVEYGVKSAGHADGQVKDGIEVVFQLTVVGGTFQVEETEVRER